MQTVEKSEFFHGSFSAFSQGRVSYSFLALDVLLMLLLLPFLLPLLSLLVLWGTRVRYYVLEGQYRREGRVFQGTCNANLDIQRQSYRSNTEYPNADYQHWWVSG